MNNIYLLFLNLKNGIQIFSNSKKHVLSLISLNIKMNNIYLLVLNLKEWHSNIFKFKKARAFIKFFKYQNE